MEDTEAKAESGFHEEINSSGHILYWCPLESNLKMGMGIKVDSKSKNHKQTEPVRILGMDLDWTLIRPVKGKVHPLDEHDWQFLYDAEHLRAISDKITAGYKLVIFTNQGGLLASKGGKMDVEGFKRRWHVILDRLEKEHNIIPFALVASLYDDFNRKPCCGMWQFLERLINLRFGDNVSVDRSASLYVGDMAGRKGDHSASDLLFAMNLDVPFQVPEVFYGAEGADLAGNKTDLLIKNVLADEHVFSPKLEKVSKRTSKINTATREEIQAMLGDKHVQSLVIFVGSPASGKSSWFNMHLKGDIGLSSRVVYLGMDTFNGTLGKFHKEIEAELKKGKNVVVDNTNGSSKAREKLVRIARDVGSNIQVIVVHFTTEKRICLYQNAMRTKEVNVCHLQKKDSCGHNVPAVAIHTYWKYFEPVDMDKEDIDVIYTIAWEPVFKNQEDENARNIFLNI